MLRLAYDPLYGRVHSARLHHVLYYSQHCAAATIVARRALEKGIRTLSFLFEKFLACGLASWCFRHFGDMVRLLRFLFPIRILNA